MISKSLISKRHFVRSILILTLSSIQISAVCACPYELPSTVIRIKGLDMHVELAMTPDTRSCGLSNRKSLAPDRGMLFLFPNVKQRTFWMKNTTIPLSIAFIDENRTIVKMYRMEPVQTSTRYPSGQPVPYALEVNQGWFESHDVQIGDKIEMNLPFALNIQ